MSRAQKLVNRAIAILQQRQQPNGLNDQKALAELRALIDRSEPDGGHGTATEMVRLTRQVLQQHRENLLNDQQAINQMFDILDGPKKTGARQARI